MGGKQSDAGNAEAVQRLQEEMREQERRDREDRLAREARYRWEETHAGTWPGTGRG